MTPTIFTVRNQMALEYPTLEYTRFQLGTYYYESTRGFSISSRHVENSHTLF
uniref:Uncharacterized protein n=1 Tax=Moniliophthora roreri TaxID=221103 RepID=A0A0W0FHN9_MONRR